MTIALSNALAQQQTQALADAFAGGFVRLFSGTRPTSPDMAETGTLLGVVTVNGLAGTGLHFVASGAVLNKADEPWVFKGLADGVVSWFRLVTAGDTGTDDLAALRIDGDVGTPAAPGDMTFESTTVVDGVSYTLDDFTYIIQPIG